MKRRDDRPFRLLGSDIAPSGLHVRNAIEGTYKDVDSSNREVLMEFPHDRIDSFKTRFAPTAFSHLERGDLPIMCWQHKLDEPIGRAVHAQITPRVNEITSRFDDFDAVPLARRAFTQIESKTITDFSFGFKDEQYDPKTRGRIISARMKEISPVSVGSIPGAKAVGVRADLLGGSMDDQEMDDLSLEALAQLTSAGVFKPGETRALLAKRRPDLRGYLKLGADEVNADSVRAALEESHPELAEALRERAIILADDGYGAGPEAEFSPELELTRSDAIDAIDDETAEILFGVQSALIAARSVADPEEREKLIDVATRAADEVLQRSGYETRANSSTDYREGATYEGETANSKMPSAKVCFDGHVVDASNAVCPEHGTGLSAAMERSTAEDYAAALRNVKQSGGKVKVSTSGGKVSGKPSVNQGAEASQTEKAGPYVRRSEEEEDLGTRAQLSSDARNNLPDEAFAYIEPGGKKDESGKTTPRSKRHFPIHDKPHVQNALSRINQGAEFADKAKPKVVAAAKKFGINVDEDNDDDESDDNDNDSTRAEKQALSIFERRIKEPV